MGAITAFLTANWGSELAVEEFEEAAAIEAISEEAELGSVVWLGDDGSDDVLFSSMSDPDMESSNLSAGNSIRSKPCFFRNNSIPKISLRINNNFF